MLKMESDDECEDLLFLLALYRKYKKRKGKRRRYWVRPIFSKRKDRGSFGSLVRVSFRGGRGGAFSPPRLTLAPPWNWQICMLREPCPPTKLHIAVLPPLGPNPERNTVSSRNVCYRLAISFPLFPYVKRKI